MKTSYTWNTKKTAEGYKGIISKNIMRDTPNENGRYMDTEIVKEVTRHSRATAKSTAIKWCRHLKSQN